MMKFFIWILCLLATGLQAIAKDKTDIVMDTAMIHADKIVNICTNMGEIKIKLYDDTPVHRDNFIKLVNDNFYDGILFHRVIKDFMIQTGDPDSKKTVPGARLGTGGPGYTLSAEILYPQHYHKYGALAAARTGDQINPERRSSGSQFYIVTGKKYSLADIDMIEQNMSNRAMHSYFNGLVDKNRSKIKELMDSGDEEALEILRQQLIAETEAAVRPNKLPENIREAYLTVGGTPHLDGEYTVFGEVILGMDIVEKIQHAETDSADRPKTDIRIISMSVEN